MAASKSKGKKPVLKPSISSVMTAPVCPRCKSVRVLCTQGPIYGITGSPNWCECQDCHFSAERFPEVSLVNVAKRTGARRLSGVVKKSAKKFPKRRS